MLKKMVTMAAKYTHVQEEMKKKPLKCWFIIKA